MASLIDVVSLTPCPSSEAVQKALRDIAPASSPVERRDRLRGQVAISDDRLRIELYAADGQPLALRLLDAEGSCRTQAYLVAVVLATWSETLAAPVTRTASPPIAAPRARVAATPIIVPENPPFAETRTVTPIARRWFVEASAGLLGTVDQDFEVGGTAQVTVGSRRLGLGGRVALWGAAPDTALLQGVELVHWTRFALSTELAYSHAVGRFELGIHAGAALGLVDIQARGYHGYGFDPGLTAGVRATLSRRTWAPYIEVGVVGWLRRQEVRVSDPLGETWSETLERTELLLSVGLQYAR